MHESDRNRLLKEEQALLLALVDMDHALAGLNALEREHGDVNLARALETGIAVSYGRAFTTSELFRLDRNAYRPEDAARGQLHDNLIWLRDKVHAHTDPAGGRTASIEDDETTISRTAEGTEIHVAKRIHEQWVPLDRDLIRDYRSLIEIQRARFGRDALAIRARLDAEQ
jgi:hypothetical protein